MFNEGDDFPPFTYEEQKKLGRYLDKHPNLTQAEYDGYRRRLLEERDEDRPTKNEALALLRKQEARANAKKEEAANIKKLARFVGGSAFIPIIFILIANGNTPDSTGQWLPDTGKYVLASVGLLALAFIISLIAKSREP